jgi:hypothetical protein
MNYLLDRLKEPSTWRGFILIATAFGFELSPEKQEAILFIGLFCTGFVGIVTPDKGKEDV